MRTVLRVRRDRLATCILLAVLAFAAAVPATHSPPYYHLYYSETNGRLNIAVRSDGKSEIGERYDRLTEARKLFEMAMMLERNGEIPQCHETGYSPIPQDGTRRINPGTAWPAPTIFERGL